LTGEHPFFIMTLSFIVDFRDTHDEFQHLTSRIAQASPLVPPTSILTITERRKLYGWKAC
jgi:hypothetical protein